MTKYEHGVIDVKLNTDELDVLIEAVYGETEKDPNTGKYIYTASSLYAQLKKLKESLSTLSYSETQRLGKEVREKIYTFLLNTDTLKNANEQNAPGVSMIKKWITGAIGVNAEEGFFASFIQEYTRIQFEKRGLGSPDEAKARGQLASDLISLNLAIDIIDHGGQLPNLESLGTIDAGAAASLVFSEKGESSTGDYAGWAGTLLFPYMGYDGFFETLLLSTESSKGSLLDPTNQDSDKHQQDNISFKKESGTYDLIMAIAASQEAAIKAGFSSWGAFWTALKNLVGAKDNELDNSQEDLLAKTTQFLNNYYGAEGLSVDGLFPFNYSIDGYRAVVGSIKGDNFDVLEGEVGGKYIGTKFVHAGAGNDNISLTPFNALNVWLIDGGEGEDRVTINAMTKAVDLKLITSNTGSFKHYLKVDVSYHGIMDPTKFSAGQVYFYSIENIKWSNEGLNFILQDLKNTTSFALDMGVNDNNTIDASKLNSGITITKNNGWGISLTQGNSNAISITNGKKIYATDYNDVIELAGTETLVVGGKGDDTYIIDESSKGATLTEKEGEGKDTVKSSADYTLQDNFERLELVGTGSINGKGNSLNNEIIGNEGNNKLEGGEGDDYLSGGAGADRLEGGTGYDTYDADNLDTILDTDGLGHVLLEGKRLAYAIQDEKDSKKFSDDLGNTYELKGTTLVINGSLKIENFVPRSDLSTLGNSYEHLGITLVLPKWEEDKEAESIEREKLTVEYKDDDEDGKADGGSLEGEAAGKNYNLIGLAGDDNLIGNNGQDLIEGDEGDDSIKGGKGNDILLGGKGDDALFGNEDDDILQGGEGSNQLYGGEGNDKLYANEQIELDPDWGNKDSSKKGRGSLLSAGEGDDTLVGSDLDDVIFGSDGNNQIFAGAGNDTILLDQTANSADKDWTVTFSKDLELYSTGINREFLTSSSTYTNLVYAGAGHDVIFGAVNGKSIIYGGIGNDSIFVGSGSDLVFGNEGDDYIVGDVYRREKGDRYEYPSVANVGESYGNDILDGGAGNDLVIGAGGNDVLYGGTGNDTLYGDHRSSDLERWHSGDDYLDGGAGDDVLYGGKGSDTLLGGEGNDTLVGDDFSDTYDLHGNDYLDGGAGNDKLWGDGGNDTLLGGIGDDSLNGGLGHDYMLGEEGNDYMQGDVSEDDTLPGNDYMDGGDGDDSLWGFVGDDTLKGGAGEDYLDGGSGNNYLYGNEGDDTLNAVGSIEKDQTKHGNNYLDGGEGNDILTSGAGSDTLIGGQGDDQLVQFYVADNPQKDNDYMDGGDGNDTLAALSGNNTLIGGKGNDVLISDLSINGFADIGARSNDLLDGGDGDDFLISGGGNDTLIGGSGNDTYSVFLKEGNEVYINNTGSVTDKDIIVLNDTSFKSETTKIKIENNTLIIETPQGKLIVNNYSESNLIQFTEGAMTVQNILADLPRRNNHAPEAVGQLDVIKIAMGADLNWTLPEESFVDKDLNDRLIYRATLANGNALPSWLSCDPVTGALIGTTFGDLGELNIRITATDKAGASASHNLVLNITEGVSKITGSSGNNVLYGDDNNNHLMGLAGNDTLIGGKGNDYLEGGYGEDSYYFARGWGKDTIYDEYDVGDIYNLHPKNDTSIVFTDDITAEDLIFIRRNYGTLEISLKNSNDSIYIRGWIYNTTKIVFANGTTLSGSEIEQNLTLAPTTIGDDVIIGTEASQILNGGEGNDTIYSNGFSGDTIIGGSGNDSLVGKNTTFYFEQAWGQDTLDGDGSTIKFGEGINPEDIILQREGFDLKISQKNTDNSILISYYYTVSTSRNYEYIFSNGTVWNKEYIDHHTLSMQGTAKDDDLYGTDRGELINGYEGNDSIYGGYGDDTLDGGSGDDRLFGDHGNDLLIGGLGNDYLNGGSDTSPGNDNTLIGGGGNDTLIGGWGNDYLDGGQGDDYLVGGQGNHTYHFESNWGNDTINVLGKSIIEFGEDVLSTDLVLEANFNGDLLELFITNLRTGDTIKIIGNQENIYTGLVIKFVDNTIWDDVKINECVSSSSYMNNKGMNLVGSGAADFIASGNGNDSMWGGENSDTFYFMRNWGNDTINAGDAADYNGGATEFKAKTNDKIVFAKGIEAEDILVRKSSNDLIITNQKTGDKITVYRFFLKRQQPFDPDYTIASINFADGTRWKYDDILAQLTKASTGDDSLVGYGDKGLLIDGGLGNDTIVGTAANDTLIGGQGNDSLYGGSGDDLLIGGLGDDFLKASWGIDTYYFEQSWGNDTIDNFEGNNGEKITQRYDTIKFGENILSNDLVFYKSSNNLIIYSNDMKNSITLLNYYDGIDSQIGQIMFADGSVITREQINNKKIPIGTIANDSLTGTANNDRIYAFGGNDRLTGNAGDDTLDGGQGNDSLDGGIGADTYRFSKGDGQDVINTGDNNQAVDTIQFTDITADQITSITRTGNNLIINYGDNDKITVTNHFTTTPIGNIAFADGIIQNFQDFLNKQWGGLTLTTANDRMTFNNQDHVIKAGLGNDNITTGSGNDTLYGEVGNDTLTGGAGDDLLVGGAGNDSLIGGIGNDTYHFGRGDGQDIINNNVTTWQTDNDRLLFQEGIEADQLWFQKSGKNLVVSVIGTSDKVTITNWYSGNQYQLDSLELANGDALLASQVDNLVNAMASFNPPASGQTELPSNYHDKLDTVIAANWG